MSRITHAPDADLFIVWAKLVDAGDGANASNVPPRTEPNSHKAHGKDSTPLADTSPAAPSRAPSTGTNASTPEAPKRLPSSSIRGFLFERGVRGLSTPRIENKLSLRTSSTGQIVLEDVRVPAQCILPGARGLHVSFLHFSQSPPILSLGAPRFLGLFIHYITPSAPSRLLMRAHFSSQ